MNASAYFRSSDFVRSSAVLLGFLLAAFVACDSDDRPSDEPEGDPADCRLIANRCHSYSAESELANECHETGHDGADPARCTELKANCLAACPEREPDSGTGGSSGGASTGGVSGTATGGASGSAQGGSGAAGDAGSTNGGTAGESSGGGAGSSVQGGTSSGGAAGSGGTGPQGGTAQGGTAQGGTSTGGSTGETSCEQLGRLCHGVGTGRPEECHEIGHDGDESVCEEELEDCLALCTDGGV